MKFILAKKIKMSQMFDKTGKVIPVTLVQAGPCVVTQVKTAEKDSYTAVQLGFGNKRSLTKPLQGHLKDLDNFHYLREIRTDKAGEMKRGDKVTADIFKSGDVVAITGVSKGKGYQGVVKRHNFSGGPASHGHRHVLRRPGSIGSRYPQHVRKGVRMAGRMGADQVTIKHSPIVAVDPKQNVIAIKGPVPGTKNTLLVIQEVK